MATRASKRSASLLALQEHRALESKLKYLTSQIERRQVPLSEIVKLLESLRRFFLVHFHKEEVDGVFQLVIERAPHLSTRAARLIHVHFELLARLDNLIRFASRGTGQPLCWRILQLRLGDFSAKLRVHESEENGLLQMAYCDDLGTKD